MKEWESAKAPYPTFLSLHMNYEEDKKDADMCVLTSQLKDADRKIVPEIWRLLIA